MATVHMMIGIQGSGKTTYAKKLAELYHYEIISTDVVRMLHPDWKEELIWPEVYKLCALNLIDGKDIIFDATNITPKVRKRFIDEVGKYTTNFVLVAYYFTTDLAICEERVSKRNTKENELYLPVEVIKSYHERLVEPTFDEGFINIIRVNNDERRSQ